MIDLTDLAPAIIQHRYRVGVRAASREIGVSASKLSRIENGTIPDLITYAKICSWLGVSVSRFVSDIRHDGLDDEPLLNFEEKSAQGARCGCRGTDELCKCQNEPDRVTRRLRNKD